MRKNKLTVGFLDSTWIHMFRWGAFESVLSFEERNATLEEREGGKSLQLSDVNECLLAIWYVNPDMRVSYSFTRIFKIIPTFTLFYFAFFVCFTGWSDLNEPT